jgi:hypothetical protein
LTKKDNSGSGGDIVKLVLSIGVWGTYGDVKRDAQYGIGGRCQARVINFKLLPYR